jgi:hypothetical protein
MRVKNNPAFISFKERRAARIAARNNPITVLQNEERTRAGPTANPKEIEILNAQSKFIDHFYRGKYTPEQRQIISEEYQGRHQKQLENKPQDVDRVINQAENFLKRHRELQLSLGRGKQDLGAIADELSVKYNRRYQPTGSIESRIRQGFTQAVTTRRNVGRALSTAGVPERIQQARYQATSAARQISNQVNQGIQNVSQGIKNVSSAFKSQFVGGLKATFFQFSMIALQVLIQIYSEQKQINQVLNEEDTFEKKGLQTEKDAATHVISKYQIVQLKASDYKSFSVEDFKKEMSTSVTGKRFVKWNLYTKVSKDYHWTVSPKPMDGKPFIGLYNTIIDTTSQPFYYYYEPSRDVTEKLLRYVGIPTLVNDQKKMEWFRFQLKFNVTAAYNILGNHYDIKKLGDEYEAVWNDGDTGKKPLGLTIDQWLSQHGQEAEAYQAYLNPTQDPEQPDTEQEYIALLNVYLETVASDPASVYLYLQSITPPLEATVFEKVWAEYNQWRIQRGLLVVSHDNLEQTQPEPVETQSQIQQSNVIAGEGVTPLSSVFGSLYKEQNIRFERQFK